MKGTAKRNGGRRKPSRKEILEGIGWKPLPKSRGIPPEVVAAESRHTQDYIVGWVQSLDVHVQQYERAQVAAMRSDQPLKGPAASVYVEIEPASEVGARMAELRNLIAPADLGTGTQPQSGIVVRCGIVGGLDRLRFYLRSLSPFQITFGKVTLLPASIARKNAVLTVNVISPVLEEINLAMEQHATCEPADSDYRPHAIVAYVKPKAVKKYVGNRLLTSQTLEVSTLTIRLRDQEPELVPLIDAPAPWKEDGCGR